MRDMTRNIQGWRGRALRRARLNVELGPSVPVVCDDDNWFDFASQEYNRGTVRRLENIVSYRDVVICRIRLEFACEELQRSKRP